MRDLAVVVPAYHEAVLLPGVLEALAAQSDRDFTLVVVDNGSTDDTAALAAAFPGDGSEDVTLLNRARRHTDRIVRAEQLVVEASLRRLRAWGPRRTLLWHWDRRYRPAAEAVHVRPSDHPATTLNRTEDPPSDHPATTLDRTEDPPSDHPATALDRTED